MTFEGGELRSALPDGTSLVVRHHHRTAEFPGLAPGESVALRPL